MEAAIFFSNYTSKTDSRNAWNQINPMQPPSTMYLKSNFQNVCTAGGMNRKKIDLNLVFLDKPAKWWLHWIYLIPHIYMACFRGVIQKRSWLLPSNASSCLQQMEELLSPGRLPSTGGSFHLLKQLPPVDAIYWKTSKW